MMIPFANNLSGQLRSGPAMRRCAQQSVPALSAARSTAVGHRVHRYLRSIEACQTAFVPCPSALRPRYPGRLQPSCP
jgi:hypothetical protein